jgi:DNA-binding transcriptional regulator GbsR (MarR family)
MSEVVEVADLDVQLKEEMQRIAASEKKPYQKPFSMAYAMRATARNIRRDIDTSIRMVSERIREFDGNLEKSKEIFETLAELYVLRKWLDEYQKLNSEKFRNKKGSENGS